MILLKLLAENVDDNVGELIAAQIEHVNWVEATIETVAQTHQRGFDRISAHLVDQQVSFLIILIVLNLFDFIIERILFLKLTSQLSCRLLDRKLDKRQSGFWLSSTH